MISLERMKSVFAGKKPDRTPFVPSIYEHGAALIKQSPSHVSQNSLLMAKAAIESYNYYQHDLVTVGIDIYNIEAEALGCTVRRFNSNDIPAIDGHPLGEKDQLDSSKIKIPSKRDRRNRLGLIIEASNLVYKELGSEVMVYACVGGPFSQAVELRSFDKLILDIMNNPSEVHLLLNKTTQLTLQHVIQLSKVGVGVNIYESWATLPLISPYIFEKFVVPYEKLIIKEIRSRFNTPPPAVILGGDTTKLIDFFIDINTSLVAADYMTNFNVIFEKIKKTKNSIVIRGNLDPKVIEKGDWKTLKKTITLLAEKSKNINNFVWGCGCVTFNTSPENLLMFKKMCLEA